MESPPGPQPRSEILGRTVEQVVEQVFRDPDRRAEHLGEAFLACEAAVRERPAEYRAAVRDGRLRDFLLPAVRESARADRADAPTGGWLGLFVGADARAVDTEEWSGVDTSALDTTRRALTRAISIARARENDILLRNLRWYAMRLEHRSYDALAAEEGRPRATIRTGVARARKFVLRVVHELEQAQPAPLDGGAPDEIAPLRELWAKQDVETLRRELERTRARFEDDPHWLNLAALVAHDARDACEARRLYERALLVGDAPSVRARVLNNLGNLHEDEGRLEEARQYWLRARQLLPDAPAPLLNLLALASHERSYASAQHFLTLLGDLLQSGRLDPEERMYVLRRLEENPKLAWLRATDAWRTGPARWLRRRTHGGSLVAAALALILALLLGHASPDAVEPPAERSTLERAKPTLLAGDSMGKTDRPRPRRPVRKVSS